MPPGPRSPGPGGVPMNSIEDFVQQQASMSKWTLRKFGRRVSARLQRMIKRRLRGESRRQWVERNLKDSEAGVLMDVTQCIIGLTMVAAIIEQNWVSSNFTRQTSYHYIDITNLVAITFNFCLRYYAAGNRIAYCLHWLSLVDLCCWVPLLVETVSPYSPSKPNKYIFRLFLMVRTIRILQIFRLLRLAKSAKTRQGILIGLTAVCIIICAAATFQTIEFCDPLMPNERHNENCQTLSFFDSIYFVCITIGTVGYGELAPKTKMGKVADIFLIVFTGILVPTQISGYTDILSRETAFDKKYMPDKRIQNVLVCGDVDNGSLNFFLHNWLHGEGERLSRRKVVILAPSLPSSSLRRILLHRQYEQRVVYLQGSPLDTTDLQRAGAASAAYCFVMTRKHSESLDQNDTATNLITCSIRKHNSHAPLYVQVSKIDNVRHVNISGASAVVCIEQLKLALFAKSLWIKGLNALMGNLVQRFGSADLNGGFWLQDYISGCEHRIYEAAIPSFLFAMPTFRSLAILLYRELGIALVGIRTLQESVMVYPVDKDINDIGFHSIFFLSKTREMIPKIERMTNAVFTRHTDISPSLDISSAKSNRTVTKVLNTISTAAFDGTFNPFQRLSVALSSETRGSMLSIPRTSTGRPSHGTRATDKIAPLNRDDDSNDSPTSARTKPFTSHHTASVPKSARAHHTPGDGDQGTTRARQTESDIESTDIPFVPPVIPVIALSPAELLKKATSPVSPRPQAVKPLVTPRSPVISPRDKSTSVHPKPVQPASRSPPGSPRQGTHLPSPRSGMHEIEKGIDGPTSVDVAAIPTQGSSTHSSTLHSAHSTESGRAREPVGPLVTAINGAHSLPTQLETGNTPTQNIGGSAPLRRKDSIEAHPNRYSRSSQYQYRSFRRRTPPKDLIDHFVVCGIPSSYRDFLASIGDFSEQPSPVIFVTPRELSEKDFLTYVQFKDIYFVRGSPVSLRVFEEARMSHAKAILIMSYCGCESVDANRSERELDENMADVDAITTHRFISEACQNVADRVESTTNVLVPREQRNSIKHISRIPYIVVEMMRPSNVKFLDSRGDSLYDEQSPENEQRAREYVRDTRAIDESMYSPLYAGGHVYFSNFMDALLGSSSQNAYLIDMMTQLIISGNAGMFQQDRDARSKHRMTQMPVPARYHNRPYALMVEGLLVNENAMALGLYRGSHNFVAPSFVLTNPAPNELVHPHDLVFVIK